MERSKKFKPQFKISAQNERLEMDIKKEFMSKETEGYHMDINVKDDAERLTPRVKFKVEIHTEWGKTTEYISSQIEWRKTEEYISKIENQSDVKVRRAERNEHYQEAKNIIKRKMYDVIRIQSEKIIKIAILSQSQTLTLIDNEIWKKPIIIWCLSHDRHNTNLILTLTELNWYLMQVWY